MSKDELLRKLEEEKKRREKHHTKFKGFVEGLRAGGQLNKTDKDMLKLLEYMNDGFKGAGDDTIAILELQLISIQTIENLGTRVSELEKNMLQLRKTLDKMVQDR